MKFSVSVTFFCDGTGRDGTGLMDKRTDTGTDRLFSENIILDGLHLVKASQFSRIAKFHRVQ